MLRTILFSVALLLSGCTASVASLFIDQSVASEEELRAVAMGWPFKFLHQDLSEYTPPSWPQSFRVNAPQDHPVRVDLGLLVANTGGWAAVFYAFGRLVAAALRAARARRAADNSDVS